MKMTCRVISVYVRVLIKIILGVQTQNKFAIYNTTLLMMAFNEYSYKLRITQCYKKSGLSQKQD